MLSTDLLNLLEITPFDKHLGMTRKMLYKDYRFDLTESSLSLNINSIDSWTIKSLRLLKVLGFKGNDEEYGNGLLEFYDRKKYLTKSQMYHARKLLEKYYKDIWEKVKDDCVVIS